MLTRTSALAVAVVGFVVFVAFAYRRQWAWTGFFYRRDDGARERRTLWDWLGLLIVPVVVLLVGVALNVAASERDSARQRAQDQRSARVAADSRREESLRGYLQQMSALVLDHNLRRARPRSDVAVLGRTLTLAVLRRLDGDRKAAVIRFLYETGLITESRPVLSLRGADLTHVHLDGASDFAASGDVTPDLSGADLRAAQIHGEVSTIDLSLTDLREADLRGLQDEVPVPDLIPNEGAEALVAGHTGIRFIRADVRGAHFEGANLAAAEFNEACLSGAYFRNTMLDAATWTGAYGHDVDLRGAVFHGAVPYRPLDRAEIWDALRDAKTRTEGLALHRGRDRHAKTRDATCANARNSPLTASLG